MGWDCSFHLVDPAAITAGVELMLAGGGPPPEFLQAYPEQGASLWAEAGRRVRADGPEDACQIACQLAIYLAAASLPHHDERGVALSFGFEPSPPRRVGCWMPDSYTASPEFMFAPLVARRPELAGKFRTCFESNCDTGVFIPAEHVGAALRVVEQHMRGAGSQRRRFVGLARVLRAAARHGYAYWEATDLGVAQTRAELLGPPPESEPEPRIVQPRATPQYVEPSQSPSELRFEAIVAEHGEGPQLLRPLFEELAVATPTPVEAQAWLQKKGTKYTSLSAGAALLAEQLRSSEARQRQVAASMLAKSHSKAKAAVKAELLTTVLAALDHEDTVVVRHALATKLKLSSLDRELFARLAGRLEQLRDDEQAMLALLEWLRLALGRKWPKKEPLPDFAPFVAALRSSPNETVRKRSHVVLRNSSWRWNETRQGDAVLSSLLAQLAGVEQLEPADVELLLPRYRALAQPMRARLHAYLSSDTAAALASPLISLTFEQGVSVDASVAQLRSVCAGMLLHEDTDLRERAYAALARKLGSSQQEARAYFELVAAALAAVEERAQAERLLTCVERQLGRLAERGYAQRAFGLRPGGGANPVDAALDQLVARWRGAERGAQADALATHYAGTLARLATQGLETGRSELCFIDPRGNPEQLARAIAAHWEQDRSLCKKQLLWLAAEGHGPLVVEGLRAWLRKEGTSRGFVDRILGIGANLENGGDCPSAIEVARLGFHYQQNPDFLYNESCAFLTAGDIEQSAKTLARAIKLDPKQARDARRDRCFADYLSHPSFAPLLG